MIMKVGRQLHDRGLDINKNKTQFMRVRRESGKEIG